MDFFRDQPFTLDLKGGALVLVPALHYCDAPAVRTTGQFVGIKQGLIYEGLVGHGAFRDRRLTIDIPNRRMLAW